MVVICFSWPPLAEVSGGKYRHGLHSFTLIMRQRLRKKIIKPDSLFLWTSGNCFGHEVKKKPLFSSGCHCKRTVAKAATLQQQQQQQPGRSGRPPCFRGVPAVFSNAPDLSWQLLEEENNITTRGHDPDLLLLWQQDETSVVVYFSLATDTWVL